MQLCEGYDWRLQQQESILAYFAAAQMSVHTKKPVSPNDLIKPLRTPTTSKKDDEEYLKEQFGLK